jgi:hypothetical protein
MEAENKNVENPSNNSEWLDHAKNYIETQKQNNETPTKEGWFGSLKEDFVGGWDEVVDTITDTWEVANTMIDSMFGMNNND